ncbi:hypothetical protein COHA_006934 [Chlorella ohadii]|uniref:VWFA domain-containing protein n=1 Tax=Chlorella ohadii TaxID=2649997 RepID=A0AAD5DN66_9CHLO|nr:hypothetical protein COHA_006934 [Chlorella ohadii]
MLAKQLGLNEGLLQSLMELPGTRSMLDLKIRLVSLADLNTSLRKGVLPQASSLAWPDEPFRSEFLKLLKQLEMPRFTRRYPKLLAPLMRQFLGLVADFEAKLQGEEAKQQKQQQQSQQQQQQSRQAGRDQQQQEQGEGEESQEGGGDEDEQPQEAEMQQQSQQQSEGQGKEGQEQEYEIDMENMQGQAADRPQDQQGSATEEMVKELLEGFKEEWAPVMENLEIADEAFDDIDGLLDDGPQAFDSSRSVWHQTGAVYNSKSPPGVIRSPQRPEETRGLTRSGDLSRMLPFEAHLLAAGWPRWEDAPASSSGQEEEEEQDGDSGSSGERVLAREGSRAARMLFMARRAERQLMSYERTGWVEDEPARLTGRMEVRPAAELGPIIVCLDTSGSMYGSREVVAKAVALECMRGAHRQQRRCYLYAFSGPGDVAELELGNDAASFSNLLKFLTSGFGGGTDVDAPLERSLERVSSEEWALADILMVTDGEIPQPSEQVLERLAAAHEELGLEVHGLLVGERVTPPMQALCTHLHIFKSWSVVGGRAAAQW